MPGNAIGEFGFVMAMVLGADDQARASMPPDQLAHDQMMRGWMTVVVAVGILATSLASILVLLRSKLALPVLVLSLAALLLSLLCTCALTNGGAVMGHAWRALQGDVERLRGGRQPVAESAVQGQAA